MKSKTEIKAITLDEYLGKLSNDARAALEKLRKTVRSAAPKAEECISYGLPAFRHDGKALVAFGATAKHCAFYLMSNTTADAFEDELQSYDTSTGTIRFQPDRPLPVALVKKLVKARIAENEGRTNASKKTVPRPPIADAESVVASLKRLATKKYRDGMARYGIPSDKALGVPVGKIRDLRKKLGRNHDLAAALWKTGIYEARMLTSFIDDPEQVTPAQMDRWCKDFDSWAICDTLCFHLFDRTPHAWAKVVKWSDKRDEFVKRAAFALLASLALHNKSADDDRFLETLPLIERAATDERNFVKKGVSWALRAIGRRNLALNAPAVKLAQRLSASPEPAPRWVGKDALRELTNPAVVRRLAAKRSDA